MNNTKRTILIKLGESIISLDRALFVKPISTKYKISVKDARIPERNLVVVGKLRNNIKFEVRAAEQCHSIAHFHVEIRGKGSGSYQISDLEPIVTNLSKSDEKVVLEWAKQNRETLVDTWNAFNGYRVTVK